ncbi:MAG: hypothetical protein Q8K78_13430 [Planctomycetaceae bacterium]|nr:hypothetical protein [Planctomycetaceae bacterium]
MSNRQSTEAGPYRSSFALVLAAFLCGGASVAWAQAAFPLSSLIDPEVALYIEIAHPDRQWDVWERSELSRRWKQTGLEALLAKSDPVQHWRKMDRAVSNATQTTLTDHIRGLCGEGLSLAVFVPNEGPPQGLWVSRARSAAVLETTLKAWDTLEPPLKTERRGPPRAEFFARRIKKDRNEQVLFYAQRDDVLILSDQEQLVAGCLQRLADLTATPEERSPNTPARNFRAEAEAVVPEPSQAAIWMYGNPRAWDRFLDREFDNSPGAQLARGVWQSLRGIGASLRTDDGITLTVAAALDPAKLNADWKAAVDARDPSDPLGMPEQLSILHAAPADAVAVAGGSFRPAWWMQQLQALQTDRERADGKRLDRVLRGAFGGLDPWAEVGTALFRDWGAFATRKTPAGWSIDPNDWHVALLQTLTSSAGQRSDLIAAIDDALGLGMQLFAAHANAENPDAALVPMRTRDDGAIGRKMTGRPAWQYGYEIAGNRLWAGWPPDDVHRHVATDSPLATGMETELSALSRREFPKPALFSWVNVERLRAALVPNPKRAADNPKAELPLAVSHLFDRCFAAVSLEPQRIEFKLGGRYAPARQ